MRNVLAVAAALAAAAPLAATLLAGVASAETRTVTDSKFFTSPSGNISCHIQPGSVRCDIEERDWERPARPAGCYEGIGYGQGITLTAGEHPDIVCAGDTTFGAGTAGVRRCHQEWGH